MTKTSPSRRVVTFYSFKGGVGRSMAVANVAYRLANTHGLKVIVVDWDLEAPGLHRFFGISREQVAVTPGVLDYFLEWREAKIRKASHPPDVIAWLVPVTAEGYKPGFGEVLLLSAGQLDAGYETKLSRFHWSEFYEKDAGAAAVETLREQLVKNADVVLIDSRTGFTDSGGICTIQLPDAVMLMTVPNEQSLEGTEYVAKAIARSPRSARAKRKRPHVWCVVCRVPFVEESELAARWFDSHVEWFRRGVKGKLWRAEEHPRGLRSFEIPHRARWSFDEAIIDGSTGMGYTEPLSGAYDHLSDTVVRWLFRFDFMGLIETHGGANDRAEVVSLQAEVVAADKRRDMLGMAESLHRLTKVFAHVRRADEAIRSAEHAAGIYLSRGEHERYGLVLATLAGVLETAGRHEEAVSTFHRGISMAQNLSLPFLEAWLLIQLAALHSDRKKNDDEALNCVARARVAAGRVAEQRDMSKFLLLAGELLNVLQRPAEAVEAFMQSAEAAQTHGNTAGESAAIEALLGFAERHLQPSKRRQLQVRFDKLQSVEKDVD